MTMIPYSSLKLVTIEESCNNPFWDVSRDCAKKIAEVIKKLDVMFILDKLTVTDGNCFTFTILQQLGRPDIFPSLDENLKDVVNRMDVLSFKQMVFEFASNSPEVLEKRDFMALDMNEDWESYWRRMLKTGEWADMTFIHCTAWFLNMDLVIVSDACNSRNKFFKVDGFLNEDNLERLQLCLGYITNTHYQSILPKRVDQGEIEVKLPTKCPACNIEVNQLMKHLRNKKCKESLGEARISELREIAAKESSSKCRSRYVKKGGHSASQSRYVEKGGHSAHQSRYVEKGGHSASQSRYVASGGHSNAQSNYVKSGGHAHAQADHLNRKRTSDYDLVKKDQNAWKAKSRENNPDNQPYKKRKIETAQDRLKDFLSSSVLGPVFICLSCHIKMFRSNVVVFSKSLQEELDKKLELDQFIPDMDVFSKVKIEQANLSAPVNYKQGDNYEKERYICKTCVRHVKMGNLPPSSVMNGLALQQTDEELKELNLNLTELESSLIAPRIIFEKILLLPKSRWTQLIDRIINIPVTNESINNTLSLLPRTPSSAGLIPITLKRRLEYKNSHKSQLVDSDKMFRWIQKAKENNHPYYDDVSCPDSYRARCLANDKDGYEILFGADCQDDLLDDSIEAMNIPELSLNDEVMSQPEEGDDSLVDTPNNPLQQFQFEYDKSVCMTDKFPEIKVAPGEGQSPTSLMTDKDWDIRAFPHLHNFDGTNGKDQEREVSLTPQRYFIQKICNKETRFSKCPAYLYAAVGYLEERQINRNISLVGRRGRQHQSDDGKLSFELDDSYRSLESIPNTPKYWTTSRFEVFAKLDNFGPFQIFFTLSCADLRWDANFAAILLEKGYSINITVVLKDGVPTPEIEARSKGGNWKPIKQFIAEDVEESYHELIRSGY